MFIKHARSISLSVIIISIITLFQFPVFAESLPLSTSFENGGDLPTDWECSNITLDSNEFPLDILCTDTNVDADYDPDCKPKSGSFMACFDSSIIGNDASSRLNSSVISLSATEESEFDFWMYHDTSDYDTYDDAGQIVLDKIQPQISVDDGETWVNLGNPILRNSGEVGWVKHSSNLSAYKGQAIMVGLLAVSGYGENMYIDDIYVGKQIIHIMNNTFDKNKNSANYSDVAIEINNDNDPFEDIYYDNTPLELGLDYSFDGNRLIIKKEFLETKTEDALNFVIKFSSAMEEQVTIYVVDTTQAVLPVQLDFEDGSIPNDWKVTNVVTNDNNDQLGITAVSSGDNPSCTPQNGTYMGYIDSYSTIADLESRLQSPSISIPLDARNYEFGFWMFHDSTYGEDYIMPQVSIDNGETWDALSEPIMRCSDEDAWERHSISLDEYRGQNIKIGLLAVSKCGMNMYIDNLYIGGKIDYEDSVYQISNIKIGDIDVDSNITCSMDVMNKNTQNDLTATMIIAIYENVDGTPVLKSMAVSPTATLKKGISTNLSKLTAIPSEYRNENYSMKLLVWNDMLTMQNILPNTLDQTTKNLVF